MQTLEPTQLGALLLSLALLIGVARLLGETARRLHQPTILGELLAGVLLGPPSSAGWPSLAGVSLSTGGHTPSHSTVSVRWPSCSFCS